MDGNMDSNQQISPEKVKKKVLRFIIGFLFLLGLIVFLAILSCPLKCTKDSVITVGKVVRVYKGYVDLITYINGEKYSVKQSAYFNPDRVGKYYLLCINKENKYCVNLVKDEGRNIELSGSELQNFLLENNLLHKNYDEEGEYKSIFLGQAMGCWILNMINISNSDSICGCA